MLTACPPHLMDVWCSWVRWDGVTSNQRPPHGYIWTPLPFHPHFALTPMSPWLLYNHCHLETKVSWRPHNVGLCLEIKLYCTTLTYVCHTYLHSPFHIDTIIHCDQFYLLKTRGQVLKHHKNLQNLNTYSGYVLHNTILSRLNKF